MNRLVQNHVSDFNQNRSLAMLLVCVVFHRLCIHCSSRDHQRFLCLESSFGNAAVITCNNSLHSQATPKFHLAVMVKNLYFQATVGTYTAGAQIR